MISCVLLYGTSIYVFNTAAVKSKVVLPDSLKDVAQVWDFSTLLSKIIHQDNYSFDSWADRLFSRYLDDKNDDASKMIKFCTEPKVPEGFDTIDIPDFVGAESGNPHLLPFDARLALGVILHDMATTLERGSVLDNYQLELFHWADWADLSILHPHMFSAGPERLTCASFSQPKDKADRAVPQSLPVSEYCVDDADLGQLVLSTTDEKFRAQLQHVQKSPNRLGFHITNHAGRVDHTLRPLFSAAHLNDFMPAPLAIVMLLPDESRNSTMVKVPVDPDLLARLRLVDSPLARRVAQESKSLLLGNEVARVLKKLPPKSQSAYSIKTPLNNDMFIDRLKEYLAQLEKQTTLSRLEQQYKDGLALSLATERPSKYLYEAKISPHNFRDWARGEHYDWRFYKGFVSQELNQPHLYALLQAWLQFTEAAGLKSWVAHGSLLSWFWNGGVFPWDVDLDVQMPIEELHRLTREYNQTIIVNLGNDPDKEVRTGRYFLDSATWISHRTSGNGNNNIDARFIDLDSGLYVDITALAASNSFAPARYDDQIPNTYKRPTTTVTAGNKQKTRRLPDDRELERNTITHLYNCRNNHYLSLEELSPLRLSYVQGVAAYIPNKISDILKIEYGSRGLNNQQFSKYAYLPRLGLWERRQLVRKYATHRKNGFTLDLGADNEEAQESIDTFSMLKFSDKDYLEWMATTPDLLIRYLTGRDVTRAHLAEMQLLVEGKDTSLAILSGGGKLLWKFDDVYHDVNNYKLMLEGSDYNARVKELLSQWDAFRSPKSEQSTSPGEKENIAEESLGKGPGEPSTEKPDAVPENKLGESSGEKLSENPEEHPAPGPSENKKGKNDKEDEALDREDVNEPIIVHKDPPKLVLFQDDKNAERAQE